MNRPQRMGERYKKRVEVMKKIATGLFKTESFHEVLCFLMLFEGNEVKENLKELMNLQNQENFSVKLSAKNLVKLKCICKVKWTNLFTLARA